MYYYGTRLSENISRREPEGYLLCLNVPVARTGTQEYLPGELGLTDAQCAVHRARSSAAAGNGTVSVYRPEEEVFSPETMASFEGMPVTNDHPAEGVDTSNIRALQKGHAHNVRRGTGAESDLLLADLIITDPALIAAILEEGKREISCGYTYELCEENGRYVQRRIRGNHVAVVDAGRAGSRVSIKDGQPSGSPDRGTAAATQEPAAGRPARPGRSPDKGIIAERRKNIMKKSLSKVLARMAKDGDIDTVAEIIEEMIDPAEAGTELPEVPEENPEQPAGEPETKNIIIDEDGLAGVLERLDRIISLLGTSAADEDTVAGELGEALETAALASEDPMAGEVSAVMEEILDPVASAILEAEESGEENGLPETLETGDALRAALDAVRPVLARMPRNVRRRMAGDIAARIRRGSRRTADADVYAALASARRRTAPASAELGKRIMESRNANYQKKGEGRRG